MTNKQKYECALAEIIIMLDKCETGLGFNTLQTAKEALTRQIQYYEKEDEIKELISDLDVMHAEVEWNYPLDYAISFEKISELLNRIIL